MANEAGASDHIEATEPTTEDTKLPAVEDLHIAGSGSTSQRGFDVLDTDSAQDSSDTGSTDPVADSIIADQSASPDNRATESPSRILVNNSSKANQGTRPEELSSSMELCTIPDTPSKNHLKRPSACTQASPSSLRKRKRGNVFDLGNDEEEGEIQEEGPVPKYTHMNSISFTPINRRQSMRLGDLQETSLRNLLPPLEQLLPPPGAVATIFGTHKPVGKNHDGPLRSKLDPNASSNTRGGDGKYPFHNNSFAVTTQDSTVLQAENQNIVPQPPPRRRPTAFDWDEHEVFTEASTVNSSFRSARSLALSVERRWEERVADLSDSIRTAHE